MPCVTPPALCHPFSNFMQTNRKPARRQQVARGSPPIANDAAASHIPRRLEMSLTKQPTMTLKKIAASRANGRLSQGARTSAGRAQAAAANLRHGFYSHAQGEILEALGEDPLLFQHLLDSLIETWAPADYVEMGLVMRLARAMWRMDRADRIQESLTLEQIHRARPVPTFSQIAGEALKKHANRLTFLASEVCKEGHFTSEEDLQTITGAYGLEPYDPKSPEHAILRSLRRLMRPGTEGAAPLIDGSNPSQEGTLPEAEESRREERQNLRSMFLKQIFEFDAKSKFGDEADGESRHVGTSYGFDSLMAPLDRNGPLMLMQKWEDSNLRQIIRITELLTKIKNGKLGPADMQK